MDMLHRRGSTLLVVAFCGLALHAAIARPQAQDESEVKVRTWLESGPVEECVDVLFVGDGYTRRQLARKYWTDVNRCAKRFFHEPPFSWYKSRFNVRAALVVSKDAGCRRDPADDSVSTAFGSFFDSATGRLLVFGNSEALAATVRAAGPADIVIVMVNTERYGGGGSTLGEIQVRGRPLPAPTFSAQDTTSFLIAIHELGHSFARLADEYEDVANHDRYPLPNQGDIDCMNVTLASRVDSSSRERLRQTLKWSHFLDLKRAGRHAWVHDGGYFRASGVLRPWPTCLMRDHQDPFCPVCCEEVTIAIFATCGMQFDDEAYHKAHSLTLWR